MKDEADAASLSLLHGNEAWHGMVTSVGGDAAPGRRKGRDDISWANTNLTRSKNKENSRGQFS
jgi:hypothetical protein